MKVAFRLSIISIAGSNFASFTSHLLGEVLGLQSSALVFTQFKTILIYIQNLILIDCSFLYLLTVLKIE